MRADFASISNLSQYDFFQIIEKKGCHTSSGVLIEPRDVYAVSVFLFYIAAIYFQVEKTYGNGLKRHFTRKLCRLKQPDLGWHP